MKLKIVAILFHTLLVLSSAVPVEEDTDYRNKEQKFRKQRSLRTDLVIEDSHFASEDLSKLQHTINEQVIQNSNRYKGLSESFQEQQQLLRTIADSIAAFHIEFSNFGKRLTQLENMQTGTPESTTPSVSTTATRVSTTLIPPTSQCGGSMLGESGVISYKEYERYNDGESCTWLIAVPEALKIGFKLEKTGLERCCDHVNVSSLDTGGEIIQEPVKLRPNRTVLVDGPLAIVRFSSDQSETGLGFRLSYYKITDLNSPIEETINESECGGLIVGETGEISYKLDESHMNNERCIWLIHSSPNSTSITFNLQDSGLERCCDCVTVTTIDPETGTLRNDTRLLSENDVTIQESTAAIVFTSDRSDRRTGFFLKFSGSGVSTNPKFVYKLLHIGESNAITEYPASESNDDDITKQHIYVAAQSATGNRESSQRFISRIGMNNAVFLKTNDSSCVYDSLTLYEPLVINKDEDIARVWKMMVQTQFPYENNALLCPEKFSVPNQEDFFDFDFHSFLAIYKPSSNDILESNTAVSFDYYYKPHQCVEILQPLEDEFGIISYKENENYKNEENCSWIIEVINATRIDFNLEQSGFEDFWDYVTVISLDMDGQTQGANLKLRAGSPTASVTGSRALVNFISDRSYVGSGFRLRYASGITLNENVCGGLLKPMLEDFGVISYKANENYANDENCEWRIEAPEWERIGFTLEQSGFEIGYDYVTISSDSPADLFALGHPVQLTYYNRKTSITASTALVRFTSDYSGRGTGFRLRYEKLTTLEHQDGQRDD